MTGLKGIDPTSYSFALVDHNHTNSISNSPTIFEVTQTELEDASKLVKSLKKKHANKSEQRKLLAAFALLSKEWSHLNE